MICPVCRDSRMVALRILPRETRFLVPCPHCVSPEPMNELLEEKE